MPRKSKQRIRKTAEDSVTAVVKAKHKNQNEGVSYPELIKENLLFEDYYKVQDVVPDREWDEFMKTMKRPLPSSFRITGHKSQAKALLSIVQKQFFDELLEYELPCEEGPLQQPQCLEWYPDGLAWQLNIQRNMIRKLIPLQKLHHFLVTETESGNISRQETVSMIPPLLLDVKPHHKVLDMCAAPGSKTAQLIEMLHSGFTTSIPDGYVVANDSDNKRCYLLVHQTKRLQSPCFLIMNHDASFMPNLKETCKDGSVSFVQYDRVLCDVPCSGDGTLRKNVDLWRKWAPQHANNLHSLQLRIAKRGLELLAVGGRLVYSTCSLNPIEDEAVISSLLTLSQGAVELVDVSGELLQLKRCPGISSWKVMSRKKQWYKEADEVPSTLQTQIRPSMFPPENAEELHLDRCMRILPHNQDTGGFFVAVLQKLKPLPWCTEKELSKPATSISDADSPTVVKVSAGETNVQSKPDSAGPPAKKKKWAGYREDPFIFLDPSNPILNPIKDFYGLDDSFPFDCLLSRGKNGKQRSLYFSSPAIRDIILLNEGRVKIINTGVRILTMSDKKGVDCDFRLCQDGLSMLYQFMHKRIITVSEEDVFTLLTEENPFVTKLSSDSQKQLKQISSGSFAIEYKSANRDDNQSFQVEMVGWKGIHSVRAFVPKDARMHILRLTGKDVSKLDSALQLKISRIELRHKTETADRTDDVEASNDKNGNSEEICIDSIE